MSPSAGVPAGWSVLLYVAADNSLSAQMAAFFKSISGVTLQPGVQAFAQVTTPPTTAGGNPVTQRYTIPGDGTPYELVPPAFTTDTSQPKPLAEAIAWVQGESPGARLVLVFSSHGDGVAPTASDFLVKGKREPDGPRGGASHLNIGYSSSAQNSMSIPDLATAVSGTGVQVVAFDACSMSMLEVGYELATTNLKLMVGSEDLVPNQGIPYDTWLPAIEATDTALGVATGIVDAYGTAQLKNPLVDNASFAAVDLSLVGAAAVAINSLGAILLPISSEACNAQQGSLSFSPGSFLDLASVLVNLKKPAITAAVTAGCEDACKKVRAAVVHRWAMSGRQLTNDVGGLSILFPLGASGPIYDIYSKLAFARLEANGWFQFITAYADPANTAARNCLG